MKKQILKIIIVCLAFYQPSDGFGAGTVSGTIPNRVCTCGNSCVFCEDPDDRVSGTKCSSNASIGSPTWQNYCDSCGTTINWVICKEPCAVGTYKNGANCTACTGNKTTASSGATSISACNRCKSGYYMTGSTCTACPANASCPTGSTTFSCNDGYYKNGTSCAGCTIPSDIKTTAGAKLTLGTNIKTGGGATAQSACYIAPGTYKDNSGQFNISSNCKY